MGNVIVKCPICEPGPWAYSGTIISKVCESCRVLLERPYQPRFKPWAQPDWSPGKFHC